MTQLKPAPAPLSLHPWKVETGPDGSFHLAHDGGLCLLRCRPSLAGSDGVTPSAAGIAEPGAGRGTELAYRLGDVEGCLAFRRGPEGWLIVELDLVNSSDRPVALTDVTVLETASLQGAVSFTHCLRQGQHLVDPCRVHDRPGHYVSHGCAGLTDGPGTHAVAVGFGDLSEAFCTVEIDMRDTGGPVALRAVCQREGIPLMPGERLRLPTLLLGTGPSLSALMRGYAACVAGRLHNRNGLSLASPPRPVETGWCSWYYYYGTETEADILENVDALAASPLAGHIRVIQIDDGWNVAEPGGACVWGDWWPGAKFPGGMKRMADRIKSAGFVPGLWLAPFSVTPESRLRRECPDWLVQAEPTEGSPATAATYWGRHALDLTHPEVLEFLRETFTRVFDEWGFEYVKVDFLLHAVQPGVRHDPRLTTAQAFYRALKIIRDVAGDRFILGCGAPLGPSIGLCDGMRIGNDVSSLWEAPVALRQSAIGMCTIHAAALQTIWRQWMHGVWWQNDPDCLVVRDYGSEAQRRMFTEYSSGLFPPDAPYGLTDEEAGFWVRLVWLTGGMALVSERMSELTADRLALLQHAFPLNPRPGHVVDWYESPDVAVMATEGPDVDVGVFNLGDSSQTITLPAARLGIQGAWRFREKISGETLAGEGPVVSFPPLPPHAGRLWLSERAG